LSRSKIGCFHCIGTGQLIIVVKYKIIKAVKMSIVTLGLRHSMVLKVVTSMPHVRKIFLQRDSAVRGKVEKSKAVPYTPYRR
jgi:hypothetical protein